MTIIPAVDIFSKTEFDSYTDWETYPEAEYECECGQVISINFQHLNKHCLSDFSNLNNVDVHKIEELLSSHSGDCPKSFLDFYCPKCKKPVRVYYDSWFAGRNGTTGHTLQLVIK